MPVEILAVLLGESWLEYTEAKPNRMIMLLTTLVGSSISEITWTTISRIWTPVMVRNTKLLSCFWFVFSNVEFNLITLCPETHLVYGIKQPMNQFGCVRRGYPKPHPIERSRWKGLQWVCLFASVPKDALKALWNSQSVSMGIRIDPCDFVNILCLQLILLASELCQSRESF